MKLQRNGQLGDWAKKCANAKTIDTEVKKQCFEMFKQGNGYRRVSSRFGLSKYTVRDWYRRFKASDEARDKKCGWTCAHCTEAKDLIEYRHEIETFIKSLGTTYARNRSGISTKQSLRQGEDQVDGGSKQAAPIPLYSIGGAYVRISSGGIRKKKEIAAVRALIHDGHSVKDACRIAGIPRCTYYRALKISAKVESDAELVKLMCDIENDKHISSTYGIERLTGEVNNRLEKMEPKLMAKILHGSIKVNHKRVHRLMKKCGIHSRLRRRKYPNNYYKEVKEALKKNRAPNLLNREFTADKPMMKLTTDVTYIPCRDQKFIYLSPLFDLFNHEIISYSVSTVNSEELIEHMLAAIPSEQLRNVLIHSDQGSLYWSNKWLRLCKRLGIIRSMSRRGNCWDNALSEHFFSAMKADLGLTKRGYKNLLTAAAVNNLITDYIPWYNTGRIQKRLGYRSPVQFKEAFLKGSISKADTNRLCGMSSETVSKVDSSNTHHGSLVSPSGDNILSTSRPVAAGPIDCSRENLL